MMTGSIRWLEVLAIGIYSFEHTDSAFSVALMLFCRTLPGVVLGAFTGTLASRYKRRQLLILGMSLATINALVMLILASMDLLNLAVIAISAIINGSIWTLEHPVRRTLLGDVAGADHLRQAMSLDQFSVNGTRLLGPLLGGAVYAALGLTGTYMISVAGFSIATILALQTKTNPASVTVPGESLRKNLVQGLSYIRRSRILRGILLFTVIANFFGFSYVTMIPVIGRDILELSPLRIGILQSMEGAGALLSAVYLSVTVRSFHYARSCVAGGLIFLAMLVLFAMSPWYGLSCIALFIAGVGIGCFSAMQSTTLLNQSDPGHRMRVMGVLVMCIGAAPAGVLTVGALADRIGPSLALLMMASFGLVATCWCLISYEELRN